MELHEAIAVRRSCRKYDLRRLPVALLDHVRELVDAAPTIDPGADLAIHLLEDGEAMRQVMPGLVGAYGKVRAPHYLFVTGPDREESFENAGFALEPIVLRLTTENVGTCWIGGSAKGDTFRRIASYPEAHVPIVIVAFGNPAEPGGHVRQPGTGSRRPVGELLLNEPGDWLPAIEAARVAPSAGNLQPWRFVADGDVLHAFRAVRVPLQYRLLAQHLALMNRIDLGIALAHVGVKEEAEGRSVSIQRRHAEREGLTYVASAIRS